MGIFVLATISAYVIAIGSVQKNVETQLSIEKVNYILLGVAILLAVGMSFLLSHLFFSRKEIKKIMQENKINF